ncbi:MAG: pullulanase-associated domain-containing protein [Candidatus Izemoplasmataceae bacterium]
MKIIHKLTIVFALFMTIFVSANVDVHAEEANKLVVHYFRFDQEYDDWSLWLWQSKPNSGEGQQLDFNGTDDYGVYYETDLAK